MLTQREAIIGAVLDRGWQLADTIETPDEWWADEFLEFQSSWSPERARVVLTFLVDPQQTGPRRKGEAVWAVAASAARPKERSAAAPVLSLGRGWLDRLSEFVGALEQFRK